MIFRTLIALSCAHVAAAQLPDAGADLQAPWPGAVQLQGSVLGASTLEWFSADGHTAREDMLVRYVDGVGTSAVGTLRTSTGTALGWPADIVEIAGQWWGVDVGLRRLYTLDRATAVCTLVGSSAFSSQYASVNSLAYDAAGDRLFAIDTAKKQLLRFNRSTGQVSTVGVNSLAGYPLIRSLAFDDKSGVLLAADSSTNWLLAVDPNNGAVTPLVVLAPDASQRVEELEFFGGELYASRAQISNGVLVSGQLARVDRATGQYESVGGVLLDCSPHALRIESVPERVSWSLVQGPGSASFADPSALDTSVTFSAAGVYQLELSVTTTQGVSSDTLLVVADGCPWDPLEIDPSRCHSNGTPFCFGDGSGTACPCGNAGSSDAGCRNSTGVGARLVNVGGTSASLDDAWLVVEHLPLGKSGLVFMGSSTKNAGAGVAFKDGLRCVAGQQKRFPVQSSGSAGTFQQGELIARSAGLIGSGSTWYFQAWYRDDASVCGKQSNFSSGLAITFQP